MNKNKENKTLYLRDGRRLGFSDLGDPNGFPIFYFHGFPSSRLEALAGDKISEELNVRLIAIDRPGIGLSDLKPQRTLLDWPDDVLELADSLQIDRFSALGISGGGPFLMACAYKISHRLFKCGSVCGLGPVHTPWDIDGMSIVNRLGLTISKNVPWAASLFVGSMTPLMQFFPEMMLSLMAGDAPTCDRNALKESEFMSVMVEAAREAFRSGSVGLSQDLIIYGSHWDFDVAKIQIPVQIWHGEVDTVVPVIFAKYFETFIPDCTAVYYPDEGHISIVPNHFSTFLKALKEPISSKEE
ncbi:MAG: alpha/beta hydrolase fold protein [Candidatus Magnetoglobus multicellularis str. Araruama]|uniref:Alpha/beta hydrolase fold protein n=1 Tax=Candidatus Magnetoglobus multicellularis str. Araruama TaxID=890399 RepID=A0A1V1P8Z1_9BACT|nr:MAG: alpha/beta hydrolase fold protein [Candidatus Magnetoglobus multicellularis str. Araruama]